MTESTKKVFPEFNIGEIVEARDRLWRIDRITPVEKTIEKEKRTFITYSVNNITGQPYIIVSRYWR